MDSDGGDDDWSEISVTTSVNSASSLNVIEVPISVFQTSAILVQLSNFVEAVLLRDHNSLQLLQQ